MATFSGEFTGIMIFALWEQAERQVSNNATANTPLFKEITAPVLAMYSRNDGKCIVTYLSNAIPPPFLGDG